MKVQFFPDTKTLHVEIAPGPAASTEELHGLIVDFDSEGRVMAITIEDTNVIEGFDLQVVADAEKVA